MKKIFLAIVLVLFMVSTASAWTVSFSWDANSETDLGGYKVYQGLNAGGPYVQVGEDIALSMLSDVANPEWSIEVEADGHYYWVVTAYDTSTNESGYSNEVNQRLDSVPPENPTGLKKLIQMIISWFKDLFGGGLRVSV